MSMLPNPAHRAFGSIASGAMVGAFLQVVTDSFGATIETIAMPWCAWLAALFVGSWRRGTHGRAGRPGAGQWAAIAVATTLVLVGAPATDALAKGIGGLSLPRASLPVAWTLLAAGAFLGPARVFPRSGAARGVGLATGLLVGLVAPAPLAALLVGGAAVAASFGPGEEVAGSTREVGGPLERAVGAIGMVGAAGLGVHVLVVLQPVLDPSPAPILAGSVAAALVVPLVAQRPVRGPWLPFLLVGVAALGAALALPHAVGIGRLVHTTMSSVAEPSWSPSLGPALAGIGLGVLLGVPSGLLAGVRPAHGERPLAAAAGLAVGLVTVLPSGQLTVGLASAVTLVALLLAGSRPVQGAGLVLGALVAAVVWRGTTLPVEVMVLSPLPGLRSAEAWTDHLDRALDQAPGKVSLSGRGAGTVLAAPEDWRATGATTSMLPFQTDLAGRVGQPTGRRAEAEVMAGLLAALLAPRLDRIMVLGDDTGSALAGITPFAPSAVDIATPFPGVVQDIARLVPARRDRWLTPGVRLWPEHPASVLRRAPSPAAVVDIAHATWMDAAHAAPTHRHFSAVHDALGDHGVYALVVHLDAFGNGAPAVLAQRLAQEFGHLQVWLPPTGADSMILVASGRRLPLARLERRADDQRTTLRSLGFPNAAALASMAIGDATSVESWLPSTPPSPSQWMLGPGLRGPIPLHLASFAPHIAPAERTWDLTDAKTGAPALAGRLDTRRRFLELLDDAARGNVAGALDKARGLASDDGGDRALRALVGPHLDNARKALALAVKEGPSSGAWADVHRFATTARMIAPTSHEPLLILGTMALAQSDLKGAQNHFAEAESLADGNLEALTGLARVALLRRDTVAAEQYFREAANANPRQWVAWHRLGVFLTETGRYEESEKILKKALERADGASPAPQLALARLFLITDRPTAALVHAETAIVMGSEAEGHFLRGQAHLALDRLDRAEQDFRQTVLADPTYAAAHGEIGRIRAVKGDRAAAEEAWKAVLRIDPSNASARENLRRLGIEERATESPPPG